jgi:hypothetical protein
VSWLKSEKLILVLPTDSLDDPQNKTAAPNVPVPERGMKHTPRNLWVAFSVEIHPAGPLALHPGLRGDGSRTAKKLQI